MEVIIYGQYYYDCELDSIDIYFEYGNSVVFSTGEKTTAHDGIRSINCAKLTVISKGSVEQYQGPSEVKRYFRGENLVIQGLIVTSNYFVAENGVTRRSRRFSVFIGCLRDDRLGNNGNIYIVHEVEENLHFLLALAAGFVRGIDDDFLDILVHDGLCQLLHIHIFLCQGDKGIQTVVHFFPLFHPFFDNFNFEL